MRNAITLLFLIALSFSTESVGFSTPAYSQISQSSVGTRINSGNRIHCSQGARLLRNRGYRNVRTLDCRGSHFVYRGDRRGRSFEITVRARDGRITDIRPLRRLR